jgi:radical SAM superfamily enzyme YgiQ (UPF0313 family)
VYGSFIAGYPGEGIDDLLATLRLIKELKLDVFRVNLLIPKPETPFFNLRKDNEFWEYSSSKIKIKGVNNMLLREFWDDLYHLSVLQLSEYARYYINILC